MRGRIIRSCPRKFFALPALPACCWDASHTLILAILVLFGGRLVNRRIPFLRDYSIPEPVTGGLIAAVVLTLLHIAGIELKFDLGARDTLLIAFFTTVGLSARVSTLAAGGAMLAILHGRRHRPISCSRM